MDISGGFVYLCMGLYRGMKRDIHIRSVADISPGVLSEGDMRRKINCVEYDRDKIEAFFSEASFLNASFMVLVLCGTCTATVNYKPHRLERDTVLLLFASHLFRIGEVSDDFRCLCLLVSTEFMEEMDSTDMIYKRIRYGVRLFHTPVVPLGREGALPVRERMIAVDKAISDAGHLYYKEVILNSLFAYYLDLSNIIDRITEFPDDGRLTRYENIIKSFIELLAVSYRREHNVEFYASRLHISAHYLTLIVKRITGQSASDFIFGMLYSEARTLLSCSNLSVQEIAIRLNFADQSSFGKFFKRRSGISPVDYRKGKR